MNSSTFPDASLSMSPEISSAASSSPLTLQPPGVTSSVSTAHGAPEPASKTFHVIRSSLEQSLRTVTHSKKIAQPVVSDSVTITTGASKEKERAENDEVKDKEKSSALWNFRRGRQSVTPFPSPVPPNPAPELHAAQLSGYLTPTLRQGSMSSPALHLYSQALPSPKSQSAIPASSSANDALVSPTRERTRRPSLQPVQRRLSDLPPMPARERVSLHRATESSLLDPITMAPTAPMRAASSPQMPRSPAREPPPTPPDTPTPVSDSRGHISRSSSSASITQLNITAGALSGRTLQGSARSGCPFIPDVTAMLTVGATQRFSTTNAKADQIYYRYRHYLRQPSQVTLTNLIPLRTLQSPGGPRIVARGLLCGVCRWTRLHDADRTTFRQSHIETLRDTCPSMPLGARRSRTNLYRPRNRGPRVALSLMTLPGGVKRQTCTAESRK
jgi:hypothetical protein